MPDCDRLSKRGGVSRTADRRVPTKVYSIGSVCRRRRINYRWRMIGGGVMALRDGLIYHVDVADVWSMNVRGVSSVEMGMRRGRCMTVVFLNLLFRTDQGKGISCSI